MDAKQRQALEEQLSAYLDGELTAEQRARVETFLAENEDARRLLDELQSNIAALQSLPRAKASDVFTEELRSRLERRALLGGDRGSEIRPPSLPSRFGRWVAAAAVVAMAMVGGYVTWSVSHQPEVGQRYALLDEQKNDRKEQRREGAFDGGATRDQAAASDRSDKGQSSGRHVTNNGYPPMAIAKKRDLGQIERAPTLAPKAAAPVAEAKRALKTVPLAAPVKSIPASDSVADAETVGGDKTPPADTMLARTAGRRGRITTSQPMVVGTFDEIRKPVSQPRRDDVAIVSREYVPLLPAHQPSLTDIWSSIISPPAGCTSQPAKPACRKPEATTTTPAPSTQPASKPAETGQGPTGQTEFARLMRRWAKAAASAPATQPSDK